VIDATAIAQCLDDLEKRIATAEHERDEYRRLWHPCAIVSHALTVVSCRKRRESYEGLALGSDRERYDSRTAVGAHLVRDSTGSARVAFAHKGRLVASAAGGVRPLCAS